MYELGLGLDLGLEGSGLGLEGPGLVNIPGLDWSPGTGLEANSHSHEAVDGSALNNL